MSTIYPNATITFQKKCLGKMEDVAKGGGQYSSSATIWLDNGQIVKKGSTTEVVRNYEERQLRHLNESSCVVERNHDDVKNKCPTALP